MDIDPILNRLCSPSDVVTFREFVTSPDFCNDQSVYEYWLEQGDLICSVGSELFSELLITGSLGGGKTTFANYATAYRLYYLFSQGDYKSFLGLSRSSPVYGIYFSTNLATARRSGFAQFRSIIDSCLWFRVHVPRDLKIDSEVRFSNGFTVFSGSQFSHALSLNVIFAILDEGDFRGSGGGLSSDYEEVSIMYSQLIQRLDSRFSSKAGNPSWSILISSASYQSAYILKRSREIKSKVRAHTLVAVNYKITPEKHSDTFFEVFVGVSSVAACIVESSEHKKAILDSIPPEFPKDDLFELVPDDLYDSFKTNILLALQNHCGRAVSVEGRLVSNMNAVRSAVVLPTVRPFFPSPVITASNADDIPISAYIDESVFVDYPYVDYPHAIFIDLSYRSDSASVSCHVNVDGALLQIFLLKIVPPPLPAETRLKKVEDFIHYFAERVNLVVVGSDSFQSKQMRQNLQADLGFADTCVSIDATDAYHLAWLRDISDGVCTVYPMEDLLIEVEEAVWNQKSRKVLRPVKGTDDLFQATVGSAELARQLSIGVNAIRMLVSQLNPMGRLLPSDSRQLEALGFGGGLSFKEVDRFLRVSGRSSDDIENEKAVKERESLLFGGLSEKERLIADRLLKSKKL
jgi:hypothetical protein